MLWNIKVRKQAINDKLQGCVATYLRCGGILNNQILKKKFIAKCVSKNFFLIGKYLVKLQARTWLYRALCAHDHRTAKRQRKCSFSDIIVSQGSAATYTRSGGTINNHFAANLPRNLPVKIG